MFLPSTCWNGKCAPLPLLNAVLGDQAQGFTNARQAFCQLTKLHSRQDSLLGGETVKIEIKFLRKTWPAASQFYSWVAIGTGRCGILHWVAPPSEFKPLCETKSLPESLQSCLPPQELVGNLSFIGTGHSDFHQHSGKSIVYFFPDKINLKPKQENLHRREWWYVWLWYSRRTIGLGQWLELRPFLRSWVWPVWGFLWRVWHWSPEVS